MHHTTQITGFLALALLLPACGPSPEAVCDKFIELAKKEDASEALVEKLEEDKDQCIESIESTREMQGAVIFKEQASCVMKAESFKDAIECE